MGRRHKKQKQEEEQVAPDALEQNPSPEVVSTDESLTELKEEISPENALASVKEEVETKLDPSQIEVQNFIIDGQVDLETVNRYKNVLSASDLEVLSQLRPGILFDLFVQVSGDQLRIDFAGNADADAHVGLSQIMRGTSDKYNGGSTRLESVRELLVQELSGPVQKSTREGLAGNFYEENGAYQEVHTGYTVEITQENAHVVAEIEQVEEEAEEAVKKLSRRHPRLLNAGKKEAPTISHFKYKDRQEKYKYKEHPVRDTTLEYIYVEARLHGFDPEFFLCLVDSSLSNYTGTDFENDFQWTLRSTQQLKSHYEQKSGEKALDKGHFTAGFITYLVNSGQELMAFVDKDQFKKMYGKVTGEKFEWEETIAASAGLSAPRLTGYQLEKARQDAAIRKLVGDDNIRITSGYGSRPNPYTGKGITSHYGLDISGGQIMQKPIRTIEGGIVLQAQYEKSYKIVGGKRREVGGGYYVRILHPSGYVTQYLHCDSFAEGIRPGARVQPGQVIATVGNTGGSTGPHLHYEAFGLTHVSKDEITEFLNDDPTPREVAAMNRRTSGKRNRDYGEGPLQYLEKFV